MKKTCLLGWFAAALMLAACQDTVNTVENADKTMTPNTIADARFVTDGFLKDRLGLQSVTMGRTADGFKRVQLEVINLRTGVLSQAWSGITGENPYKIRYRFTWFDEDGMAVNNTVLADWRDATIIPGETLFLQSVAPTKYCSDFKISLKEAN
ncbi:MAG: YcfL family protein [Lentisphaeria bacterium]|nr:YcfL family protein [Lentisphaeria bacterium]MDD6338478.1 YcfL family protein [Lentisphaeria bacterium]